ncbi:MAG: hypothetical protein IJ801_09015 [Lachnospiraceae bacterium]|nr:hypothetical protein [Lachnospiraceae bacterium]
MFHDRINRLLNSFNVRNNVISEYASTSPTTIGRYRNGIRVPKKDGKAVCHLVNGLIQYAKEQEQTDIIYELLAQEGISADETNITEHLHTWLYADTPVTSKPEKNSPATFSAFAERLGEAMELAEVTNARLARMVNTDCSLISKFRRGHRTPKSSSGVVMLICRTLVDRIVELNKTDELIRIINAPQNAVTDEDILLIHFEKWLCDFKRDDQSSIGKLLQGMDTFTTIPDIPLPSYESIATLEVKNDTKTFYMGTTGLQNAVIRFLIAAIESDAKELLLYSDQNTDWMVKDMDFRLKWLSLMSECVRREIRIEIIHNIERSTDEMLDAIHNWMPLYMSGMVEPYYCTLKNGQRFSHTVFLCPNVACIEAGTMGGGDEEGLYNYYTDMPHIDYYAKSYNNLLYSCRLLMRMELGKPPVTSDNTVISDKYENLCITLGKASVHISKLEPPYLSFTFLHPLMYEAFRAYVKK